MRSIITTTFVSMDGVMQAPGGPEEDTTGGFKYGGWSFNYWDEDSDKVMSGFMKQPFELLLGRKTYDIFSSYWPNIKDTDPAGDIAKPFNATRKYVVSHQPLKLAWKNSFLVTGDVPAELRKLKQMDGPDLWVHGSGELIQTLLAEKLIDRMHIWTCPATLGLGKRLFTDAIPAANWKLVDSKITTKGVIIATYEPNGEVKPGSFV